MTQKSLAIVFSLSITVAFFTGCSSTPDPTATPEEQMIALDGGDLPLAALDVDAAWKRTELQ